MNSKYLLIIFSVLIAGCAAVSSMEEEQPVFINEPSARQLRIWMLSDIQPKSIEDRVYFEKAVEDVKTDVGAIDVGVMAGDLLQSRSGEEAFDWFVKTRESAPVANWYEIAGNHDVRSGEVFKTYFPIPLYYGVRVGNVLLLLLSDESKDSRTDISDAAFSWWARMVRENQDKIIITVTHAQLKQSGLLGSVIPDRRIGDSERFAQVLRDNRTAVWASGHSHLPHALTATVTSKKEFNKVIFVNVSSIGEYSLKDSQSRFFIFEEGSKTLWLRSRNHTKQRFEPSLNYAISLQKPFSWDGQPAKTILP